MFTTGRELCSAEEMTRLGQHDKHAKDFQDATRSLCLELSAWVHTGQEELDSEHEWSHDPDDISLLITKEKRVSDIAYYRPEALEKLGIRVVDAGHGGLNLCLIMSVVQSLIMHCLLLDIPPPNFVDLKGKEKKEWAAYFVSAEDPGVKRIAKELRKEMITFMRENRKQLLARLNWATEQGADLNILNTEKEPAQMEGELSKLEQHGFLGMISMAILVTVMHKLDGGWFEKKEFKIINYGCASACGLEDKLVEILPYDFSAKPHEYVSAAKEHAQTTIDLNNAQAHSLILNKMTGLDLNMFAGVTVPTKLLQMQDLLNMRFAMFGNTEGGIHYRSLVFAGDSCPVQYLPADTIVGVNVPLARPYITGLPRYSRVRNQPVPKDALLQAVATKLGSRVSHVMERAAEAQRRQNKKAARAPVSKKAKSGDGFPETIGERHGHNLLTRRDERDEADLAALTQVRGGRVMTGEGTRK